jgi:hypothetical protein
MAEGADRHRRLEKNLPAGYTGNMWLSCRYSGCPDAIPLSPGKYLLEVISEISQL